MPDRSRSRSDEALLRLVAQKDQAAYEELFSRYIKRAFALATNLIHNRELAEEAAQETMLTIWRSAPSFDPDRGPAQCWIFQIIANSAFQISRKEHRNRTRENRDKMPVSKSLRTNEPLVPEFEQCELKNHLRALLAKLPLENRQLVTLYFGANLSQDKIAKLTSIPQRNISTRLKKILEQLKSDLTKGGFATPTAMGALIQENLWSGWQLPKVSSQELFERIIAHKQTKSTVANAKGNRPSPLIFASGILFLGALSAAAFHFHVSQSQKGIDQEALSSTVETRHATGSDGPTKRWHNTWDFNSPGSTDGMTFENKKPFHDPKGGWNNTGCLSFRSSPDGHSFKLERRHLPVKITCQIKPDKVVNKTIFTLSLSWPSSQCQNILGIFQKFSEDEPTPPKYWTTFIYYIQPHAIDCWKQLSDNAIPKRSSLLLVQLHNDVRFELHCSVDIDFDNLTVEEVTLEDLPDISDFISTYAKRKAGLKTGQAVFVKELSAHQYQSAPIELIKLDHQETGTHINVDY